MVVCSGDIGLIKGEGGLEVCLSSKVSSLPTLLNVGVIQYGWIAEESVVWKIHQPLPDYKKSLSSSEDSHDKHKKIKSLHSSNAYAKNNIGQSFSDPE